MHGHKLIGQEVVATREIYEGPNDYSPGGVWAGKGARLVVYRYDSTLLDFAYGVHPVDRPHVRFGVNRDEIEPVSDA